MKNKRITLSLGKTFSIGDHEYLKVGLELSGDIGDARFAHAIKKLSDECHQLLKHEIEITITKHHG